ncbi:MAG: hypothetical protein ACLP0J_25520 [Solirubrobacteraceae bacterium]|jgi:hypothetical protein
MDQPTQELDVGEPRVLLLHQPAPVPATDVAGFATVLHAIGNS